jgi:penicillin-binding protein 1B
LANHKKQINSISRNRLFKWVLSVFVFLALCLTLYCWHLSTLIEKRFSGRRWSIPSTIFSDITILYPGQSVNTTLLYDKLAHLGYREIPHSPMRKGELHASESGLEIFLHDLNTPSRKRPGFPVKITFAQNRIESIVHPEDGKNIPILELEPEKVMSFFGDEREQRKLISFDEVPRHLIYAILAAEDIRFYRHKGMDPRAILRALYTNLRHAAVRQGASTITQQLAKNYFLTPKKTFSRKLIELLMSLTIEVMYDKDEILEIYLNEIYLGQEGSVSVNGVGEASHFYFGKPVGGLSLAEAATIAGLIRSPNNYSPYMDKKRCIDRRNTVLRTMNKSGWISDEELQAALSLPLETIGFSAYGKKADYFMDYLSLQLKALYPPEVLTSEGFTIYTTLDTQVQTAAEAALAKGLARLEANNPELRRPLPEKCLQGAIIVMQPKTGYVLAMVGGRNYAVSQFNRITQAQRQPGSAFKPFVFLSGMDNFTTASILSNEPRSYEVDGELWEPRNYETIPEKNVSFRAALAKSVNLATVDLAVQIGVERIISTAERFHFSTPLRPCLSISLGSSEVIPLELARAYCTFAADGVLPYPLLFKAVMDKDGKILERQHMEIERVTSPAKAFIMTSMLRSVIEEGTGRSLKDMGVVFPVAGKTGTTNGFRDAWFVGYTPDILALVWVGFDDGGSIGATGASAAMPIWADLINAIPQHVSGDWFKMPPGVVKRNVCPESGQLAIRFHCPKATEEVFLAENAPEKSCPVHINEGPFQRLFGRIKDLFSNF